MFEELAKILKDNYQIENIELSTNFKKDLESYRSLNTVGDLTEYLEGRIKH